MTMVALDRQFTGGDCPPFTPTTDPMTRRMRRSLIVAAVALLVAMPAFAHDMFIKLGQYFVRENATVSAELLNGTFVLSENSITRDRLLNIAVVSPAGRTAVDTALWNATGDTSRFEFKTGAAGTYVLGVSTRARVLEMTGAEFNAYLRDDGIPDELAARRAQGRLEDPAKERYHKHVKALVQVGATPGAAFATVLGYPAELVPVENPYQLKVGATLSLRVLVDGKPRANQLVQYGGQTASGGRVPQLNVRSDAGGIVRIPISRTGPYYVKFISMQRLTGDAEANHESKWASLTFGVR